MEEGSEDDDDGWNPSAQLGAEDEDAPGDAAELPQQEEKVPPAQIAQSAALEAPLAAGGEPEVLNAAGMVALEEAMEEADRDKTKGNRLFQDGRYRESVESYSRGASRLEVAVPSRLLTLEAKKLLIALYCNGAQASLKCSDAPNASTDGACTMADRALALDPTNVKALFRRGLAYANAQDWQMACDDFLQAFNLDPGNEAVHKELQKAQGKLGIPRTPPPPKKVTERPLRIPEDVVAFAKEFKDRGTSLFQSQQYWAAYEAFKRGADALESDLAPRSGALGKEAAKLKVGLCNNAAMSALRCGDVKDACTDLAHIMAEKVLELEPENVKALFRRGLADVNAGCFQMARQDFQTVLSLDPGNKEALRELQKIDGGPTSDAQSARTEALTGSPAAVLGGDAAVSTDAGVAFTSATAAEFRELEPGEACKLALERIQLFREQILAAAEAQKCSLLWSQRLNKLQIQTADWAKHQLADPEMSEDLNTVNGHLFASMDAQQKEDFVMAYEFEIELKRQYSAELGALLGVAEAPRE